MKTNKPLNLLTPPPPPTNSTSLKHPSLKLFRNFTLFFLISLFTILTSCDCTVDTGTDRTGSKDKDVFFAIASTSPKDGDTDIPLYTSVAFDFEEDVYFNPNHQASVVTITSTNAEFETIELTAEDKRLHLSGSRLLVGLNNLLVSETTYTVTLTESALTFSDNNRT